METTRMAISQLITEQLAIRGFRLCDLSNTEKLLMKRRKPDDIEQYIPTSGIVTWRAANPRHKIFNMGYGPNFDSKSGIVYGRPESYDHKTGAISWNRVFIDGVLYLDLSNPQDRIKHFLLWHDQRHRGGPCYHGMPHYSVGVDISVFDPEKDAREATAKRKAKKVMADIVDEMPESVRLEFAANMGIDTVRNSATVAINMLYEKIENDPKEVEKRYNDPNRKVWEIFHLSIQHGVLLFSPEGYYYGETLLGADKRSSVSYLAGDSGGALLSSIKSQVDEKRGVKVAGVKPNTKANSSGSGGDTTEFF